MTVMDEWLVRRVCGWKFAMLWRVAAIDERGILALPYIYTNDLMESFGSCFAALLLCCDLLSCDKSVNLAIPPRPVLSSCNKMTCPRAHLWYNKENYSLVATPVLLIRLPL